MRFPFSEWLGHPVRYNGEPLQWAGARAIELARRLGGRLRQEGYKGFFEVDVLVDLDTDEVYLGELNSRISGASPMTNVTAGAPGADSSALGRCLTAPPRPACCGMPDRGGAVHLDGTGFLTGSRPALVTEQPFTWRGYARAARTTGHACSPASRREVA
jgi:hypothetical protein